MLQLSDFIEKVLEEKILTIGLEVKERLTSINRFITLYQNNLPLIYIRSSLLLHYREHFEKPLAINAFFCIIDVFN